VNDWGDALPRTHGWNFCTNSAASKGVPARNVSAREGDGPNGVAVKRGGLHLPMVPHRDGDDDARADVEHERAAIMRSG